MALATIPAKLIIGRFISFRAGDIVVLVDSTWRSTAMLEALFKVQFGRGVILGAMVHDLFPLLMPELCQEVTVRGFSAWFAQIIPRVDFFVTNSEATRKALNGYLQKHPELRPHFFCRWIFSTWS